MVSEKNMKYDPSLVATVTEVLIARGWKSGRRRSNTDPGPGDIDKNETKQNSSSYKGKKNPLGRDGNVLTCFKCIYHLQDKCQNKTNNVSVMNRGGTDRHEEERDLKTKHGIWNGSNSI